MQVLAFAIPYMDRLAWYFQISIIGLVPNIVAAYKKNSNTLQLLYVLWFIFQHIVMDFIINGDKVYPYMGI